jgi:phosphatidylethanolamine/phosphatidyl-N-methylethanolamine N-methyltransferase
MTPPDRPHPSAYPARPALGGAPAEDRSPVAWRTHPPRGRRFADTLFAHFVRSPFVIGGVVPSSRFLARAMSCEASGFESIVELGAGTGSLTRRLVADHPRIRLIAVERDVSLARRLARSCPQAAVREGCVHQHLDEIGAQPARTAIVSSLPFRSLPASLASVAIATLERFLLERPAGKLIQYSYGLRAPFAFSHPAIEWRRVERVWRNVPPALVWVARRTNARR